MVPGLKYVIVVWFVHIWRWLNTIHIYIRWKCYPVWKGSWPHPFHSGMFFSQLLPRFSKINPPPLIRAVTAISLTRVGKRVVRPLIKTNCILGSNPRKVQRYENPKNWGHWVRSQKETKIKSAKKDQNLPSRANPPPKKRGCPQCSTQLGFHHL